jgi:hypothetical protein
MSRYGQSGKTNAQVGPSCDELYSEAGSPGSTYSYDPFLPLANGRFQQDPFALVSTGQAPNI